MKQILKKVTPPWLLRRYRDLWRQIHARRALDTVPLGARELYRRSALMSYDDVILPEADEADRQKVIAAATDIYGPSWNYYSDALRPEIVMGFVRTIEAMDRSRPVW